MSLCHEVYSFLLLAHSLSRLLYAPVRGVCVAVPVPQEPGVRLGVGRAVPGTGRCPSSALARDVEVTRGAKAQG